ncbi:MAG: phage head morphogenesis protein [Acidobacteriota bacterium]|nr:phage head morphogenesis protein [Acidobacteriota bacterium]
MPDLQTTAEEFKARLIQRERIASSDLVRVYGLSYARISESVARLTGEIDAARASGAVVSPSYLTERDRLARLQFEIEVEMRRFSRVATSFVTDGQASATTLALSDARQLLGVSGGQQLSFSLGNLNTRAVEAIAGTASDGSPLAKLFDDAAPRASRRVRDELMAGVAEGASARVIASRIKEAFGGELGRALTVARTETLSAYRTATLDTYEASGVVTRWRWLASKSSRTCAMCWAMDGKEFALKVRMHTHPNCRCTLLPVTESTPATETGEEVFAKLDAGAQSSILGPAKFDAFKANKFVLADLVGTSRHPRWGESRHERSLSSILNNKAEAATK